MKWAVIVMCLALVGCDIDNPYLWEFQVCVSKDASPQDLVAIEACLRLNGYKRVKISYSYLDGHVIYATRKEKKESEVKR